MIQKCDFKGCDKAGICRAPKSRDLREYFHFCRDHAAEYNKNWNYYANMTPEEMDADWERDVFGYSDRDKSATAAKTAEYLKFLDDFIKGRAPIRDSKKKETISPAAAALKNLALGPTASWRDVQIQYRKLAKMYHPDTARNLNDKSAAEKFAHLSASYTLLQKHFKK
jgi:hypothetical protein